MEPTSPQWLPELAGGQLQTELCELVEVGWKRGGEGWGRKVEPRKQGRLVGVSSGCWRFGPPKLGMGEQFVFICFFLKTKTFCFDCWGEAVIGKKKGPETVGFMLGDAQVQDGVGATITRNKCWGSLSLFLAIFSFEEVLNGTLRVPCLFLGYFID